MGGYGPPTRIRSNVHTQGHRPEPVISVAKLGKPRVYVPSSGVDRPRVATIAIE